MLKAYMSDGTTCRVQHRCGGRFGKEAQPRRGRRSFELLVEPFEIDLPKNHLLYHIVWRSEWQGNPWTYTCFWDESLNKSLKKCLRLCHQANFERRAFTRIAHILSNSFGVY